MRGILDHYLEELVTEAVKLVCFAVSAVQKSLALEIGDLVDISVTA